MARHVVLSALLLVAATSSVTAEPPHITFPGARPLVGAIRGGAHFEPNADFLTARPRIMPQSCSGLASATDASVAVIDYEGGKPDGVEVFHRIDIPDRDVVTIELSYADPGADLDLILFQDDRIVAISNIEAAGHPEKIVTTAGGGGYTIGVSAIESSSVYSLSVTSSDSTVLHCERITELDWRAKSPPTRNGTVGTNARRRTVGRPLRPGICTYAVSPMTESVAQAAGLLTITVTAPAGCDWKASSNVSWLRLIWGSAAYGNGTAGFSIAANTGSFSRTGTLTVAGKTITITQSGPCIYSVSPTSPQIPSSGGINTLTVTAGTGCAWTASVSATATWITITSGQSGSGNGTVTYSVAPNTATSSRTGTMTVAGKSVSVKQALDTASCTYAVAYTSKTMSWCGGQRGVAVTTQGECPWTASKDATWITLGTTNRTGSGSLAYLLSRNTGGSRQGTIVTAGTPVVITQNALSSGGPNEGVWKGTTNSSRNVELCVADGAVQDGVVTVRLSFPTFSCTGPLFIQDSVPITGSTFSGPFTFTGSTISTTVRGTFTSSTAMNGSHDGYSGSYLIICGSAFSLGTGTILSSGTYTATKQP